MGVSAPLPKEVLLAEPEIQQAPKAGETIRNQFLMAMS
jgi:hypothetical protein